MIADAPLFATLMTVASLTAIAGALWWNRRTAVAVDVEDIDGLSGLFDELSQAAEAEGVYDTDFDFTMAEAANITPVSDEDDADLDELMVLASRLSQSPAQSPAQTSDRPARAEILF